MGTFPLDIRTDLNLAGQWTDASDDVYVRDPKQITRGRRDQGAATDPSSLSLTLNNKDGKYSPRNAMSPLFGLIGRNTPVRVSVPGTGSYLQLDGDTSHYVSTPDATVLDITGDLDVRAEVAPNWWSSDNQTLIGKWGTDGDQRSWLLQLYQGSLYFRWSVDGTAGTDTSHSCALPAVPDRAAVRVTLDADNGAGGRTVRFYWATSLTGTWTLIDEQTATGTASVFSGSAPLMIAPTDLRDGGPLPRFPLVGRAYRYEVRSGIDGTVVAAPDFTGLVGGTVSFTDSAGLAWTVSPGAEIRDREDRFVGEISTWPQKWVPGGFDVWTPVTASGVLRRMGQGQKPLDSTLRRRIPSGNPIAYWPMEEAREASRAYSPVPGVEPAAVTGIEFAAFNTLVSSGPLPRLEKSGFLSARVPASTPGQWQVEFVYNADDKIPADYSEVIALSSQDGTVRRWVIRMKAGLGEVQGFDQSGTDVVPTLASIGADVFHGWTRLRFWARDNGNGTFTARINWQDVGGEAGGMAFTLTGTCGSLSAVTANWGEGTEGWGIGHLAVLPTANSALYDGSDDAFLGETAWERMRRLSEEEHFPLSRIAGELPVQRVGYQRPEKLLDLLEDAADADGGILMEDPSRLGLRYRDRSSLYTQDPALTLVYDQPGLGPDLEPVDDDSAVRNDIAVTRDGGTSGRAFLEDGPLAIGTIGLYDEAVTLSLADDTQPEPIAYWRLHLGTYDGARYPTVSVMLHKPGADVHIPAVLRIREGDLIRLTGLPPWVAHGDVDLIVEGWSETLDLYRWEVTFNCSPAGPWNVAQADHPTYGKADTDGSELAAAVDSSATRLPVTVTAGPVWTTDPAEMPIPIQVGGEELSAAAITPYLDTFTRSMSGGWGTSPMGEPWTWHGNGTAADYDVDGSVGRHLLNTRNTFRITTLDSVNRADVETLTRVTIPVTPTGDGVYAYFLLRTDPAVTTYYFARLHITTTGTAILSIRKRTPTETLLATASSSLTHVAGQAYFVRFRAEGSTLSAKAWRVEDTEPGWQVTATDSDPLVPSSGGVGLRSFIGTSNTNALPVVVSFDDFTIPDMQAFTVERAVNGVVKSHAAGTAVRLAHPAVASL